ncbi:MAG TPA: LpxD N-terminal domain-containing protein [Bacteroidales bacterium]|nr:LpxD N-terminal domain-containing protein [Bacteroidales bacterium]HQN16834.1 LpxD N-terminal domain-containing protein [Bacteroidales bacterium]
MKFEKSYTLKEIAGFLNGKYLGDDEHKITGINEIHMVEPGDITFVDFYKYYDKALNSEASTIIINKDVTPPDGKALIISDDPFRDYNKIVARFRPFEPCAKHISDTATIGQGTIIQPGVFIGNHVTIGENCIIHPNVSIYDHTIIGNNVIIQSNSVIGGDAYYFKRRPTHYEKMESCGRTILEDDVEIGALCAVDKGVSGDTIIGKGTKLDNHVQIGHDTHVGKHCLIGAHSAIAGVTIIEDEVCIWAQVMINKDIVVGKGAVLLATSAIDKSVEGGKVYFGSPAIEARKKWREIVTLRKIAENYKD